MSSSTDQRLSDWNLWLASMSPERLAKQRAYDRERGKKYHEEHKEELNKKRQEYYKQHKEHYCEKHVCETCGGRYITSKKAQCSKTKLHQAALLNVAPTCFKCNVCGGRYSEPHNEARHEMSKKHQAGLQNAQVS